MIRISRVLSFNHYWFDIGKNYWDISTKNSILTLCGRAKLTHCFIQFSSETGPISNDAQRKGEFKISNTGNENQTCPTTTLNFSGKVKHELQVTSSNPRVMSSNLRVTSSNLQVMSLDLWVASSSLRVRVQICNLWVQD